MTKKQNFDQTSKFTKGPWYYEKDTTTYYEGETYPKLEVFSRVNARTLIADLSQFTVMFPELKDEAEANAALISKAPALYEALKWINEPDGDDIGECKLAYSIRNQNLSDSMRKKAEKWEKVVAALNISNNNQ
jgi:hypothetical protein